MQRLLRDATDRCFGRFVLDIFAVSEAPSRRAPAVKREVDEAAFALAPLSKILETRHAVQMQVRRVLDDKLEKDGVRNRAPRMIQNHYKHFCNVPVLPSSERAVIIFTEECYAVCMAGGLDLARC